MAKEKVLSSVKKTSSTPTKSVAPAAPKVDNTNKHKEALVEIVNIYAKLKQDTLNRNFRVKLNEAIEAAAKII